MDDVFLTFQTTSPPQPRMGHDLLVLFARLVLVVALDLAHAARVEPVVRAHRDGHEAERCEGANRGQQHLNPAVKQTHISAFQERGSPFPLDV